MVARLLGHRIGWPNRNSHHHNHTRHQPNRRIVNPLPEVERSQRCRATPARRKRGHLINTAHVFIEILGGGALAALWIATVISILRSSGYSAAGQIGWVVVALIFPLVGPTLWWAAGRRRRRRRVTMNSWWT